MQTNKKVSIQMWRAFACACVFFVHFGQRMGFEGTLRQISDFGARGVHMFFIISGYLIAKSFCSYGRQDPKLFTVKRLVKLLPLYYIVIGYYFIVHVFLFRDVPPDPTRFGWLRYVIPLNDILPATDYYFWDNLGITWTIPHFFVAYLLMPVLLKHIRTYKGAAVLLAASFVVSAITPVFQGWLQVLSTVCYFCEGAFLYYACTDNKKTEVSLLLMMIILGYLILGNITPRLYSFVFMVLILVTEDLQIRSPRIQKILSVSDRYSYTMYLAHGIVFIHCLDRYPMNPWLKAFIAIAGTAILTYGMYTWLEMPLQRKLQSMLNRRRTEQS